MALHITPTAAPVGAYVQGFRMDLSRGEANALYRAFLDYGVLVFTDLELDVRIHMALGRLFGEADDPHPLEHLRHEAEPNLTVLTANGGNPVDPGDPDADRTIGAIPWHADRIYSDTPNRMVGGAPDALPDSIHPLVYVHPETDMPVLNIAPATAREIVGLPRDEAEELLDYLVERATREEDAYVHNWNPGDVVAWDNHRAIHRAYGHPKRYPRVMHTLALKGRMKLGEMIKSPAAVGQ